MKTLSCTKTLVVAGLLVTGLMANKVCAQGMPPAARKNIHLLFNEHGDPFSSEIDFGHGATPL